MREVTDHKVTNTRDELTIQVVDEPGAGGANHAYIYTGPDGTPWGAVNFQNGAIQEKGVNGITNEVLLATVIDRLRSFQAGPYPSDFNQLALQYAESALHVLQDRTRERISRGVEGQEKA